MYSKPAGSTATDGTTIEAAMFNTLLNDIANDLNVDRPVTAGGTGSSTAATARAALGLKTALKAIDTTGSSNAYLLTTSDSLTPTDGDAVVIVASFANTGAATIDVDSTGAKDIKKVVAGTVTALATGDIYANAHYLLTYDSSASTWIIVAAPVTGVTTGVSGTDLDLITGTAGTENFTAKWDANGDLIDGFEVLDEDDMSSDSATKVSTQQAIKAYVDSKSITSFASVATTSGSSKEFTGIQAGADRLTFMLSGVSLDGDGQLLIQIGDAGGYESSDYVSIAGNEGASTVGATTSFRITRNVVAAKEVSGTVVFTRHSSTKWIMAGATGDGVSQNDCSGRKTLSAALTRIKILNDGSDLFDGGSIALLVE